MEDKVEEAAVSVSWQRFCRAILSIRINAKFHGHCICLLTIQ